LSLRRSTFAGSIMHGPSRIDIPAPASLRVAFALVVLLGLLGLLGLLTPVARAQSPSVEPAEGLRDHTPRVHALVNARVVVAPGRLFDKATVVIRDQLIEAVGADLQPPQDARVWDLAGKTIYPGLIDLYSEWTGSLGNDPARGPRHWNPHVT